MPDLERQDGLRLSVVLVRSGLDQSVLSLDQLVHLASRTPEVSPTWVLVDMERKGGWFHAFSDTILHIGGGPQPSRPAALARAAGLLRSRGIHTDVFALIADHADPQVVGRLLSRNALTWCHGLSACLGRVISLDEPVEVLGRSCGEWADSRHVLVPDAIARDEMKAIDPGASSGLPWSGLHPSPAQSETISQNLMQLLASRYARSTQAAAGARLLRTREAARADLYDPLWSAHLKERGYLCLDERLLARLGTEPIPPSAARADELQAWAWNGWQNARVAPEPRFAIDSIEVPGSWIHGDQVALSVVGWALAEPSVREVVVQIDDLRLEAPCTVARPDLHALQTGPDVPYCGFRLEHRLDDLAPGPHEIRWAAPQIGAERLLAKVTVAPRCELNLGSITITEVTPETEPIVFALAGEIISSSRPDRIQALLDGVEAPIKIELSDPMIDDKGLCHTRFELSGETLPSRPARRHLLELKATCGETSAMWRRRCAVRRMPGRPHLIARRKVLGYDPRTGLTGIDIGGVVLSRSNNERLVLTRDGRPVASAEARPMSSGPFSTFEIKGELEAVSPGPAELSLLIGAASDSPPSDTEPAGIEDQGDRIISWHEEIGYVVPEINVEMVDVSLLQNGRGGYLLRLAGWVQSGQHVPELRLLIDGKDAFRVPVTLLRSDVADYFGESLARRQGFAADLTLGVGSGPHTLALIAEQDEGPAGTWRQIEHFEEPARGGLVVISHDLALLKEEAAPVHLGAIAFRGHVDTRYLNDSDTSASRPVPGGPSSAADSSRGDSAGAGGSGTEGRDEEGSTPSVYASLEINGALVDRHRVGSQGRFELRHELGASTRAQVRVRFEQNGSTDKQPLFDSGPAIVRFEKLEIPLTSRRNLELFIDHYDLRGPLALTRPAGEILRMLIERRQTGISELVTALEGIGKVLSGPGQRARPIPEAPAEPRMPLRALFATWEVPCWRHGGGVWMANVLRHLGKRHEITIVTSYNPEEEGWVDDLRPHVGRVISVPRAPHMNRVDPRLPSALQGQYDARLHYTVESEAQSGRYDLVEYQYSKMYPHRARTDIPRLLALFEDELSSRLTACRRNRLEVDGGDGIDRLEELIREHHFRTVMLPSAYDRFIAVTEEDAAVLRLQSSVPVYVNTIGVEPDQFTPPGLGDRARGAASMDHETLSAEPSGSRSLQTSAGHQPAVRTTDEAGRSRDEEEALPALVFLGNYRHQPNVDAALFLASMVLPRLRAKAPRARLLIVGSHPTDELRDLARQDGIKVVGFVADHRPYLWRAAAFVAPLFSGAGMRVKILEAMAAGTPVISTMLAMNGVGAEPGRHFLRAETTEEFATACERCLARPDQAAAIGAQGRELIISRHRNEVKAQEREAIWYDAIERTRWRRDEQR